ncbi:radical SAM protein [Kitasatospora acidiphila]|uniref:Radical SAM protein n=1 Tax=Kitasatospora acidiphila TaxID=2567942 RepID=A0A540W1F8_9ACTN|nr:radical SAM protein [Kitasatospora acidiphila]TQF02797.1 radical SAM protein [Kitasatospora acidiphila]
MTEPVTPPQKTDRDEVFLEFTKSICPVCKAVVDAQVNIRQDKVYLRKRCKEHGRFEALVYGDAQQYLDSARFNKPGTLPLAFQTEVRDGCPTDCGLCPEHKQHACLGIIEVNSDCNLDCPICFADSGHQADGFSLTLDQVEKMLDTYVAAEGEPEVVMFSGGEPSIHKHILDFIDAARSRPIGNVVLNTNGIRLATDRHFAPALAERGVIVYLQFDGFAPATHLAIRGKDLRELKQRALDACAVAGLRVMLAAAVERGLNDHEAGAIIRFGLEHPAVRGVVLQPVTHSGRHLEFDPLTRLTNSDVIQAVADQLPDLLRPDDFFPVPCCFPTCRSVSYLLTDGTDVVPLTRLVQLEDYLDYIANRALPEPGLRGALEKLWSASAFPGTATTSAQLDCATCGIDLPKALRAVVDKAFMLVVQDFQDPYTLNVKTLMKCCVEMLTPDGRIIPFCAYNSVGYREQVREQLTGVPVADVVPNATGLQLLLEPSPHGSKTARNRGKTAGRAGNNTGEAL